MTQTTQEATQNQSSWSDFLKDESEESANDGRAGLSQ